MIKNDESLNDFIFAWEAMRILTLGDYLEELKTPLKEKWLFHDLLLNTSYEADIEEIIVEFWEKVRYRKAVTYSEAHEILKSLNGNNDNFITAHWLNYIFDLQMPAEKIWSAFGIFHAISRRISDPKYETSDLKDFIKEKSEKEKVKTILKANGIEFSHRFMTAVTLNLLSKLKRTIGILRKFDGSLIRYLSDLVENYNPEDSEWIRFIAYSLNMLSYTNNKGIADHDISSRNIINYIISEYEKHRTEWNYINRDCRKPNIRVNGTKRLWAALRDYILHPYFQMLIHDSLNIGNTLKKYYIRIQWPSRILDNEYYIEQLELPGDVWNNRFFEESEKMKVIDELKKRKLFLKRDSSSSSRRIYTCLLAREMSIKGFAFDIRKLYPVYLDYSFYLRDKMANWLIKYSKKALEGLNHEHYIEKLYDKLRSFFYPFLENS